MPTVTLAALATLALALGCDHKSASPESAGSDASPGAAPSASGALTVPAPPDVGAPPPDAERTASGLASKVLTPGTGKVHPGPTDTVKAAYTGWTKSGQMFDSSVVRGEPATFAVDGVIPGWGEGLRLMVVGEKRRLWIPAKLAYGDPPKRGMPAGDLTFDVELLDVQASRRPPPAPEDVAAPPATAKKTGDGLAYVILTPADGKKPKPSDTVRVHYTGWTTDGKMFDSSIPRGEPASFRLDKVIKGWTEGVTQMHVGEKARFWIPPALAYGSPPKQGKPAGTLVFDIELFGID